VDEVAGEERDEHRYQLTANKKGTTRGGSLSTGVWTAGGHERTGILRLDQNLDQKFVPPISSDMLVLTNKLCLEWLTFSARFSVLGGAVVC
jgi:hypothetical protein